MVSPSCPNDRGGGRYVRLDLAREWLLIKALFDTRRKPTCSGCS